MPKLELYRPRLIVSGGQTGVDRAALDVARAMGLAIGGWCPRGRWAEDGAIASHYAVRETDSDDPAERTRLNIRDSDATLVLTLGASDAGTQLTIGIAQDLGKPIAAFDLSTTSYADVGAWLTTTRPRRLNIAGPRESRAPGIYARAQALLRDVFGNVAFDDGLDEAARR